MTRTDGLGMRDDAELNTDAIPLRRRVLWLSHFLPWPPKGGLMQRSYNLIKEVSRYHDVRVVAFHQHAHQPDASSLLEATDAISAFAELGHVSGLPEDHKAGGRAALALRSILPGAPYTIRWGTCDRYRKAVELAIEQFEPHVIHFDTVSLAPYRDLAGATPTVLNHHNIESHMLRRRAELEGNLFKKFYFWQEGWRLASYEKKVASLFTLHLVCAELDAKRLREAVGEVPISQVPNGADLDYFVPAPPATIERPDSMIFVGGLSWYPNASAMRFFTREVWPILSAQRPSAVLQIVGRHPPKDLLTLAERDSRIHVTGFVNDMRPLVHESMVYVCPIYDGGGTKLKMIDAMAIGKAIVAHPVAAEGLGLVHGRDVLLSADPQKMADLCIKLFDDSDLRRRLGRAARDRAEQAFGFPAIGNALALTYAKLT